MLREDAFKTYLPRQYNRQGLSKRNTCVNKWAKHQNRHHSK